MAITDVKHSLEAARESGHAATLMNSLSQTSISQMWCGNYALADAQLEELLALANEKGSVYHEATVRPNQGCVLVLSGNSSEAVHMLVSGISAWRSIGATLFLPKYLSHLATAYAKLGQFDEAWGSIGEAMTLIETSKEKWAAAEVHRVAGEIALISPEPEAAKAQAYFERAIAVARKQQAKSWELRAAMSMARLWRDQGKRDAARELLTPVYDWFTEGFDTLDLKNAKALLGELA
jgi:predicted ATPase